ncbi:MAG: malto-oligosyltrehalose trehalohydrolase [Tunicatimonas sp.]
MELTYTHQPVGAIYQADAGAHPGVTFTLWAPLAESARVLINKETTVALEAKPFGYWSAHVPDAKPGDLYYYQIDDQEPRPDPASLAQPSGVHGPSEVIDTHGFRWQDDGWQGLPLSEMIIYELHVGTFTPEGTFMAIIDKLDYFTELGVNALEIMPVAQFPGERNWGYDGVYPYAAQHSYGGALGLMQLVNACHQRGIAVILDVVYNHLGPEGNYLPTYGPYLTDKHHTPWGLAINMDDAYCDGVRHYFLQNARQWLADFRIDGLRLDAVHAIKDTSARHFLADLSEQTDALSEQTERTYVLIGECDLNDVRYLSPRERGGFGLTGQWIDEFHHSLHAFITGEQDGYYEDFGTFDHVLKAFRDSYVYDGQYSKHRQRAFGNSAADHPYDQFVVFTQNHDQVGNRMVGDRLTTTESFDTLKLLAGAAILSPSVPMLFMGEEYGEKNPFQYFVSHTDPALVKAVREGRTREFAYFQREGLSVPDPQAEETFRNSTLSWSYQEGEGATLLRFYKKLIELRQTLPGLQTTDRRSVTITSPQPNVLLMGRAPEPDAAPQTYVAFNFGETDLTLPPFTDKALIGELNSTDGTWRGEAASAATEASLSEETDLQLKGRSFRAFRVAE